MIYMEGINSNVLFYSNGGIVLPLFIGAQIEAKNHQKNRFSTSLPFTNKGEIAGIFLLYKSLFNVDQYVSEVALGSLSLLVILSV